MPSTAGLLCSPCGQVPWPGTEASIKPTETPETATKIDGDEDPSRSFHLGMLEGDSLVAVISVFIDPAGGFGSGWVVAPNPLFLPLPSYLLVFPPLWPSFRPRHHSTLLPTKPLTPPHFPLPHPLPRTHTDNSAQFRKFATESWAQKRGYGTRLLSATIETCRERGVAKLWCDARAEQTGWYEKRGLKLVGEPFEKYVKKIMNHSLAFISRTAGSTQ